MRISDWSSDVCSSDLLDNNFNAPASIAVAAVLYVFRSLVDDDIPLNAGCLKPLEIIVPSASMLNPNPPAAVVAGNVETSMCIVNRSEEHTSELQSLMRISYAVFCLKKKTKTQQHKTIDKSNTPHTK